jgi:hypothetical protein
MSTPKYTSATSQAKCETRYESQSLPGDTSRYQSFFGNGAELPDPTLAWEDLSPEDRRALTELLVDKIVVGPHPHKIVDGRRHYIIRAIPYQDHEMEAARLKAVHEARVKIVPRV